MNFRFVILGDIHVSTRGQVADAFHHVVQRVVERAPRCVVLAGDMTSGNPDDGRRLETVQGWWEALDGALAPFAEAGIPVLPVAGNHDHYTDAHRDGYDRAWADLVDRVGPLSLSGQPPRNYSVRLDGLHLALAQIVDQGIAPDVERWLIDDLAAAGDADLRLVVGHVPLRSAMGRTNSAFERRLAGLLIDYDVACYFAGHEHLAWDIGLDVGAGSVRQIIVGTPGARYTFPLRGPLVRSFCRGARGWMPWSRLAFDVAAGTGDQTHKVVFAEVEVLGGQYAVELYAVDHNGRVLPFWRSIEPPADVAAVIDARHVQRGLNRVMDAGLVVDGVVGPATRAAIRAYQAMEGLPETGAPDAATRDRLAARLADPDVVAVPPPPEPPAPAPDEAERLAEEEIRWIQMALNRLADADLVVDGLFGPRSRAALSAWQRDAGLPDTGIPDGETLERLRAAFEALIEAPLPGRFPADGRADHPDEIRWLQAALNRAIGAGLTVDGASGRLTRAAVRRFQDEAGLAVDGIAGPRTLGALRARVGG